MHNKIRKHFYFSGEVQGVGFRYHAQHSAEANSLTGWVCNLCDGRVEMELQGSSLGISRVLGHLSSTQWIEIRSMEEKEIPLVEEERGFRVRGYY